jgi:hypothetical protein
VKPIFAAVLDKFSTFVETEGLLQLEKDPATGPYPFTVTLFIISKHKI